NIKCIPLIQNSCFWILLNPKLLVSQAHPQAEHPCLEGTPGTPPFRRPLANQDGNGLDVNEQQFELISLLGT
ncbi:1028_t:CDS:2, partial [Acaulospora colombiana]